jgi:hypothetical protein
MMALYATAGGALRLPYTSGPVPLKSNVALPSRLQGAQSVHQPMMQQQQQLKVKLVHTVQGD